MIMFAYGCTRIVIKGFTGANRASKQKITSATRNPIFAMTSNSTNDLRLKDAHLNLAKTKFISTSLFPLPTCRLTDE